MRRRSVWKKCLLMLLTVLTCAAAVQAQPTVDLVLCIDGSGSIGVPNEWQAQLDGIAAALLDPDVIPHDGSVRITVIQFADGSQLELGPVVVTALNAANLAMQVTALQRDGGSTNLSGCFDDAVSQLSIANPKTDHWVIDVSTDNRPSDHATADDHAADAMAHGVDQINVIAVGPTAGSTAANYLDDQIALPGDDGRLFLADDFGEYTQILRNKIRYELGELCAVVDGLQVTCATDGSGDAVVTLTFTNFLVDDAGNPFAAEHVWLTDGVLFDDAGNIIGDVVFDPEYHSFQNDPICSAVDPACSEADATRTITFGVSGALAGGTVELNLEMHDENYEPCCEEPIRIELPDCTCAQLLRESTFCRWLWPEVHHFFSFTLQNLFTEEVTEIRLTPITPPTPQIGFSPSILTIFPPLAPPPIAGATTQTVEVTGPAATSGQQVRFFISTHNEHGICCSIEHEITLQWCRRPVVVYPYPVSDASIKILGGSDFTHVTGFSPRGDTGITFDAGSAEGVLVSWSDLSAVDAGGGLRLSANGKLNGQTQRLGGVSLSDAGGRVAISADSELGPVQRVTLYAKGTAVTTLGHQELLTATWPAGAAFDRASGGVSLSWTEPVEVVGEGTEGMYADQVVFEVAAGQEPTALTSVDLTAAGIEALQLDAAAFPSEQ